MEFQDPKRTVPLNRRDDEYYYEDDEDWYYDWYDGYDDFAFRGLRGESGMTTRAHRQTKDKQKSKSKNGRLQNVYSSKHIKAKVSLRASQKAKGKGRT
eukprot:CAMPEP_0197192536 /NCGR_PEP_ID=MMETSP1423-20130617/25199_1 /TAXON_ID=476441 /ORGANISM="Pseudo-nitzschia heimii, Strain UNC1101" /LENGTH=97 /DNA_ID=CAMNT_0042645433 /DNA_START=122 /DNA_END=415 /DNA_ORIENTATION=-